MEDNFIKSYSNYVLSKKHQNVNDGYIMERDATTIGGVDSFSKGQIPVYKSSNFIITVNNEIASKRKIVNDDFNEWTEEKLNENESFIDKDSEEIIVRQNYYKLKDFAYYGSCVELIRASLNNITKHYPGALTVPKVNNEYVPVYYTKKGELTRLGGDDFFLVINPSNINIHTKYINEKDVDDVTKYFANNGFEKYYDGINSWEVIPNECKLIKKGSKIAEIILNKEIHIFAYIGEEGKIIYLIECNKDSNYDVIAKPKENIINNFFKGLDSFEKVLLNRNSSPKYTALFEVMDENKYGYETEIKQFTFPSIDSYNLDFITPAYDEYVNSLYYYAKLYDELFCDNLYRSMTHESIKNFDWSYSREFDDGKEKEYKLGGNKIKKVIRLFGREFDELKLYIDGIRNYNNVEYGDTSTMPEFFFNDSLKNDGWDVINVYPFKQIECNGKHILQEINKSEIAIKPYSFDKKSNIYTSEKEYSIKEINKHFLKMLKLNSRNILSKKGTIEGIESLLSLFGLKSKRMDKDNYDYEITEYIAKIDEPIEDKYDKDKKIRKIDWINSTKTITYDTDEFRNGIYIPYQGLPVEGFIDGDKPIKGLNSEEIKEKDITLYPYFSYNNLRDGNTFYQMHGGWLNKSHKFVNDKECNGDLMLYFDKGSYNETYESIKIVKNLEELIELPISTLKNNDIYFVENVINCAIIDGVIYKIYWNDNKKYVNSFVYDGLVKFGTRIYQDEITVFDENGNEIKNNLNDLENGTEIKSYIYNDNICIKGKYYSNESFQLINSNDTLETNYFEIKNIYNKNIIGNNGWERIKSNSDKLNEINTIKSNFKGNNPHCGNLNYDSGFEYISYFSKLFKYPLENNMFNEECYDNFNDKIEDIKKIGFKGIANIDDTIKLKDSIKISNNEEFEDKKIINLKNISITFNKTDNNEIIKFYDYVVMNYLEQLLPSTIISDIEYNGAKNKCEASYDYSKATLSFDCDSSMSYDQTNANIRNVKLSNISYTGSNCVTSITEVMLDSSQYSVSYEPSGTNTETTDRDVKITVTSDSNYGSKSASKTITQGHKTCTESKDYSSAYLTFDASEMSWSDTTSSISNVVIKDIKKTNSDCTISTITESISDSNYSISYSPSGQNTEEGSRQVTITLKTNSTYGGYTISGTKEVTQNGHKTCSPSYDYSNAKLSFTCDNSMSYDQTNAHVKDVKLSNVSYTGSNCVTSITEVMLDSAQYSVSYEPSGANTGTTDRDVKITVTSDSSHGSKSESKTITQKHQTCSPSYDYSSATLSFNCDKTMSYNQTDAHVKDVKLSNVEYTDSNCVTSTTEVTLDGSQYSVSYNPSGSNTGTTDRSVTVIVTSDSSHGSKSESKTITQKHPCTESYDYTDSILNYDISKTKLTACETDNEVKISNIRMENVKHVHKDCSITYDTLTAINVTKVIPQFSTNETDKPVEYEYEISCKDGGVTKTKNTIVTQDAGPCHKPTCTEGWSYKDSDREIPIFTISDEPQILIPTDGINYNKPVKLYNGVLKQKVTKNYEWKNSDCSIDISKTSATTETVTLKEFDSSEIQWSHDYVNVLNIINGSIVYIPQNNTPNDIIFTLSGSVEYNGQIYKDACEIKEQKGVEKWECHFYKNGLGGKIVVDREIGITNGGSLTLYSDYHYFMNGKEDESKKQNAISSPESQTEPNLKVNVNNGTVSVMLEGEPSKASSTLFIDVLDKDGHEGRLEIYYIDSNVINEEPKE